MNTPDTFSVSEIQNPASSLSLTPTNELGSPAVSAPGASSSPVHTDPDVMIGMLFRENRQEAIERFHAAVRRHQKRLGDSARSLPRVLHYRVLRVERDWVTAIAVESPVGLEERLRRAEVVGFLRTREWVPTAYEPMAVLRLAENQLSSAQKACRTRNRALIQPLIDLGDEIFDHLIRGKAIRSICDASKVAPETVYRVLRRYLKGGRSLNALAGRWFRRRFNTGSGARIIHTAELRAGRVPRRTGRPRRDGKPQFVVTEPDVRMIIRGAADYYHTPDGGNWRRAWMLTIARNYLDHGSSIVREEELRKITPDRYPSESQFKYWAKTDPAILGRIKKQVGERYFDLNLRLLTGRAEDGTTGPGSHYIIDPTPFDVIAVHRVSRRPIGRLTLYIVIDAFSHLIVGFYVYVGSAGYDPASLALLAAAQDKVELCRQFGIEISKDEWPSACLPAILVADSELASLKAHSLVEKEVLNVRIVPAYRADLKGLVEAMLGSANRIAKHLPGHTTGNRKRATVSPEATAALDYGEINQVVIGWIRQRNRRVLTDYQLTDSMIADGVVATPINLWNWGVSNCGGLRRTMDDESLKRDCLPQGSARITRRGLEFSGLYYEPKDSATIPDFELWRVKAATRGWAMNVSYHPASVADLWLHHDGQLVRMQLTAESRVRSAWSFADLESQAVEQVEAQAVVASEGIPMAAMLEASMQEIVENAVRKTEEARGTVAKRRLEKVDKVAERADQKHEIEGRPLASAIRRASIVPHGMAEEDERGLVEALMVSSEDPESKGGVD